MNEKEKQIAEMAKIVAVARGYGCTEKDCCGESCKIWEMGCFPYEGAKTLYNAGFRKQREGEWLERKGEEWIGSETCQTYTYYNCSICDGFSKRETNFCPDCGARMKVKE